MKKVTIEILRCEAHGYWCVAIDSTRITPSKCCGSWKVFESWEGVDMGDMLNALPPVPNLQAETIEEIASKAMGRGVVR